jgi:hypothetical protein
LPQKKNCISLCRAENGQADLERVILGLKAEMEEILKAEKGCDGD